MIIGDGKQDSDYDWDGSIDELRLYNRSLSADEINATYWNEKPLGYSTAGASENGENITITTPDNTTYYSEPIDLTWTNQTDYDSVWYSLNGGANITITGDTTFTPVIGYNDIILYMNTSTGAEYNDTESFTYLPTVTGFNITQPVNGSYIAPPVINITYDYVSGRDCAGLTYSFNGGTNISIGCGNQTIDISENATGYYNITLWIENEAGYFNTSTIYFHIVNPIVNCSDAGAVESLIFIFRDEEDGSTMNGSSEYAITVFSDSFSYVYNFSVTNVSNFSVCIQEGPWNTDMFMSYVGSGYPERFYFFEDTLINTTTDSIYLYLLEDALANSVLFTVRDQYQNLKSNIIIYAQRYFPVSDTYTTVAMGKTGPEGTTSIYLKDAVWYKYILVSTGSVVANFDPQQMVDNDITLFIGGAGELSFFNYYGSVATNCYYNETTLMLICTYADTSGKVQVMNLTVAERFLNNTPWNVVCYDDSTSVSGTLTCDLTTLQNRTLYYKLRGYQCCSEATYFTWVDGILELGAETIGNLGMTSVLMAAILFISAAAIGFFNPRLSILLGLIVFVLVSPVLKILPADWSVTGGILVVGVILIYVMGGRTVKTQ